MKRILLLLLIVFAFFMLTGCNNNEKEKVCSLTNENLKAYLKFDIEFIGEESWGQSEDLKWTQFKYALSCNPYDDKYIFEDCIIVAYIINPKSTITHEVRLYLNSEGHARVLTETIKTQPYAEEELIKLTAYKIVAITGNIYKK